MLLGQRQVADAQLWSLLPRPGARWRIRSVHTPPRGSLPFSVPRLFHVSHHLAPCNPLLGLSAFLHVWPPATASPLVHPFPGSAVLPLGASPHPSCHSLKLHPWVTRHGAEPLPSEDENCTLVEVTEEEVENSVKHIPSLATVVRRTNH